MKKRNFQWIISPMHPFNILKKKVTERPILSLPYFNKVFQLDCDASGEVVGAILSQQRIPEAFFNEKSNEVRKKYSIHDKEFYAITKALKKWRNYLLPKQFVLFTDHKALQYINNQSKLNQKHSKWIELFQSYKFVLKHKFGK